MATMMKCGHASQAVDRNGHPACAICSETTVADAPPDLTGRMAECSYGPPGPYPKDHKRVPSSIDLAFFEHRPDKPTDRYYCGCFGWD